MFQRMENPTGIRTKNNGKGTKIFMKKKKNIILAIIVIIVAICLTIILVKNIQDEDTIMAETTLEEREFWNEILYNSPYIGEIEYIYPVRQLNDNTDLLKIALVTDDIETEDISESDISKNFLLTEGKGYKKSKKNIDAYLEKMFDLNLGEYNFINTFSENGEYIIIDEDYIYYTKINVPEKIYIAVNYNLEGEDYTVLIYEYIVTDDNREQLQEMLETGKIKENIELNNYYIIKGTRTEDSIKISYKYTNEEKIIEMDEMMNEIPKGASFGG